MMSRSAMLGDCCCFFLSRNTAGEQGSATAQSDYSSEVGDGWVMFWDEQMPVFAVSEEGSGLDPNDACGSRHPRERGLLARPDGSSSSFPPFTPQVDTET